MGVREILTAPRSPGQSPDVERLIGSIRREGVDPVMVFSEAFLRRTLRSYLRLFGSSRPHLSLGKDAPEGRTVQSPDIGPVVEKAEVGGLHHRYVQRVRGPLAGIGVWGVS